jgi:hypothetical protein
MFGVFATLRRLMTVNRMSDKDTKIIARPNVAKVAVVKVSQTFSETEPLGTDRYAGFQMHEQLL